MKNNDDIITAERIGWQMSGEVVVTDLQGNIGEVSMKSSFIPKGQMTKSRLLKSINDSGIGSPEFISAVIDISSTYQHRKGIFTLPDRTFMIYYEDYKAILIDSIKG